jgi:integrase
MTRPPGSPRNATPANPDLGIASELAEAGLRKQSIRKFDERAGDDHRPPRHPAARPRRSRLLPSAYRLPLLVLDATGMRVGELEALASGDVDEQRGRWRVKAAVAKTGAARRVTPPAQLFAVVVALVPRDDRVPERPVFGGFGADRFRTALTRACTAAGVPTFSPHDLRHRRVSLLHAQGLSWARIGSSSGTATLLRPRGRTRTFSATSKSSITRR